jgi:hypothetical protein
MQRTVLALLIALATGCRLFAGYDAASDASARIDAAADTSAAQDGAADAAAYDGTGADGLGDAPGDSGAGADGALPIDGWPDAIFEPGAGCTAMHTDGGMQWTGGQYCAVPGSYGNLRISADVRMVSAAANPQLGVFARWGKLAAIPSGGCSDDRSVVCVAVVCKVVVA